MQINLFITGGISNKLKMYSMHEHNNGAVENAYYSTPVFMVERLDKAKTFR